MTKFYTGVGSRNIPTEECEFLRKVAVKLKQCGYRLRSGHAAGADSAFEEGAFPYCDIYIPWNGFSDIRDDGKVYKVPKKSIDTQLEKLVHKIHPAPDRLSRGAKALHKRNMCQVMGDDLNSPSDFLICWAPTDKFGVPKGGTRTAWVYAEMNNIPRYNTFVKGDKERLERWLSIV